MQVYVRVIEAKDIAKMDTIGTTDAFCILSVNKRNDQKTKIVTSLTPTWKEDFTFTVENPVTDTLDIVMKDHDAIHDDFMAKLSINISSLPVGVVVDHWYPMQPMEKVKKGGLLHLLINVALPGVPPFTEKPQIPLPNQPIKLHIRLIEAKEIKKMDAVGYTDAYAVVSINNSQTKQTKVSANQQLPKWDESFSFDISNPLADELVIKLCDKDVIKDDAMGTFTMPIRYLPFQLVSDQWITLAGAEKVNRGGLVHILCHLAFPDAPPFVPTPIK